MHGAGASCVVRGVFSPRWTVARLRCRYRRIGIARNRSIGSNHRNCPTYGEKERERQAVERDVAPLSEEANQGQRQRRGQTNKRICRRRGPTRRRRKGQSQTHTPRGRSVPRHLSGPPSALPAARHPHPHPHLVQPTPHQSQAPPPLPTLSPPVMHDWQQEASLPFWTKSGNVQNVSGYDKWDENIGVDMPVPVPMKL